MGPGEVDSYLDATGDKKSLRFPGYAPSAGASPRLPPSPVKRRSALHLLLDHQRRRRGYNARRSNRRRRRHGRHHDISDADADEQMDKTALTALQARVPRRAV